MKLSKRNRKRLVRCARHGDIEGYIICKCVADGLRRPVFVEHPGQSHPTLGTILCVDHTAPGGGLRPDTPQHALVLVCGFCARDRGLNSVLEPAEPPALPARLSPFPRP